MICTGKSCTIGSARIDVTFVKHGLVKGWPASGMLPTSATLLSLETSLLSTMRQISCGGYDIAHFYADRSRVRENTHLKQVQCNL